MPYPESCPECMGTFRNTGTHFTGRRNEIGRHVLLELGCQNTSQRYWWDFTAGRLADNGTTPARPAERTLVAAAAGNGNGTGTASLVTANGHAHSSNVGSDLPTESAPVRLATADAAPSPVLAPQAAVLETPSSTLSPDATYLEAAFEAPTDMRSAFVRQVQLDRLTLRQMRGWVMSEEARRAVEIAASATEATYERLALALFGNDLSRLTGRAAPTQPSTAMSAEERLELQREKARIRARQRRAAIKAGRLSGGA
jgi:hypothetical protein